MNKNRRITLHQKIGKGIKFNYITSKNAFKNVSGIQNVIIYVGTVKPGYKIRSKSFEIMCLGGYRPYPGRAQKVKSG